MRKTFELSHPKIKLARLVESIKHDVKKYIKRERNKSLPEGADFLDFDCKFGSSRDEAKVIHLAEINTYIDQAEQAGAESFYLEIIAKGANRNYVPREEEPSEDDAADGSEDDELEIDE